MAPDAPPTPPPDDGNAGTPEPKIRGELPPLPATFKGSLHITLQQRERAQREFAASQAKIARDEAARIAKINAPPPERRKQSYRPTVKGQVLSSLPARSKAVDLKIAGKSNADIARVLGLSTQTIGKYLRDWVLSLTPPDEKTEEVRRVMFERLEKLTELHWPRAMGRVGEDGDWAVPPSKESAELILKVMDRAAKLTGADQQASAQTLLISAESIAAYLGWDPQGAEKHSAIDISDHEVLELPPADEPEEDDGGDA